MQIPSISKIFSRWFVYFCMKTRKIDANRDKYINFKYFWVTSHFKLEPYTFRRFHLIDGRRWKVNGFVAEDTINCSNLPHPFWNGGDKSNKKYFLTHLFSLNYKQNILSTIFIKSCVEHLFPEKKRDKLGFYVYLIKYFYVICKTVLFLEFIADLMFCKKCRFKKPVCTKLNVKTVLKSVHCTCFTLYTKHVHLQ